MKKVIKVLLLCLLIIGIGVGAKKSINADYCDVPPEGPPVPISCPPQG